MVMFLVELVGFCLFVCLFVCFVAYFFAVINVVGVFSFYLALFFSFPFVFYIF